MITSIVSHSTPGDVDFDVHARPIARLVEFSVRDDGGHVRVFVVVRREGILVRTRLSELAGENRFGGSIREHLKYRSCGIVKPL